MDVWPRRLTVARVMALVALVALTLGVSLFIRRNGDIDRAILARLLDDLRSADPARRAVAAEELARATLPQPGPALQALTITLVSDPAAAVRREAARTLGPVLARTIRRGSPPLGNGTARTPLQPVGDDAAEAAAVRALGHSLRDPDAVVRRWAVESLGRVVPRGHLVADLVPEVSAGLLGSLDDADPEVRAAAAGRLADLAEPPPAARARLIALVDRDPDPGVRAAAITALRRSWQPQVDLYPGLLRLCQPTASEAERAQAIRSLGTLPPPPSEALGPLLALAEAEGDATRVALEALGRAGPLARPTLGRLQTLATQRDRTVGESGWIEVAETIAAIDPESPAAQGLLPRIDAMLGEPAEGTNRNYRGRLLIQRFGPAAASLVPAWRARLVDPTAPPAVRHQAARLLGTLGAPAVAALADLEALARTDPNDSIRWALTRLQRVEAEPAPTGPRARSDGKSPR